jgi:flagellar motility protein MotE (MotC chaperone)
MIARLLSPLPAALFALLLALAAGPLWFYFKTDEVIGRIIVARQAQLAAKAEVLTERKAQGWDFWTIEMENLSNELKEEKKRLQQQSDQLDQRAGRIAADRQELDRIRYDLESIRRQIDAKVVVVRIDEAKNLKTLASTYATLSPKAAVAILKEMDDTMVVKILSLMKIDVVGPIFEEMSRTPSGAADGSSLSKRAATISDKIRLLKAGLVPAKAP